MKGIVLVITAIISTVYCHADTYQVAASTAMTAAYRQSGYDTYVNAYADRMQAKYVAVELKDPVAVAFFVYKLVNDRSIGYKWTF